MHALLITDDVGTHKYQLLITIFPFLNFKQNNTKFKAQYVIFSHFKINKLFRHQHAKEEEGNQRWKWKRRQCTVSRGWHGDHSQHSTEWCRDSITADMYIIIIYITITLLTHRCNQSTLIFKKNFYIKHKWWFLLVYARNLWHITSC